MSMIKWEAVYASIAAKNACSASYVKRIHRGESPTNTNFSKAILRDLHRIERDLNRVVASVAV